MRRDVLKFAEWMSQAMDSKAIERDSRSEPHYLSADYPMQDALERLQDKTEQLVYWADDSTVVGQKVDRIKKTAVHLAKFCMIIAAKAEAAREKIA